MFPEPPRSEDGSSDDALDDDGITIIELGDLDAFDSADEEFRAPERGTGSLEAFVGGNVRSADVVLLSDLDREAMRVLAREWPGLPAETRERILREMRDLEDLSSSLRFGRAWQVAVEDPEPAVRQIAAAGLADVEEEEETAGRLLLGLLRDDPSLDVRTAAARALGRFAELALFEDIDEALGERICDELFRVAENDAEPAMLRRAALEAISVVGGERIDPLIRDAFEVDDIDWKASALFAMGRSGQSRWLPMTLEELASPEAQLLFEAARACGGVGEPSAAAELMEAIDGEEDMEVRHAIIGALGQVGGRPALRALRTLARMAEPEDEEALLDAIELATIFADDPETDDR